MASNSFSPERASRSSPRPKNHPTERAEAEIWRNKFWAQMPVARTTSRAFQEKLGIEKGTKMVHGKVFQMPKPLNYKDHDDSSDEGERDENDGDNQDDDDNVDDGEDDRKSQMDEADMGMYDDGVYDDPSDSDEEMEDAESAEQNPGVYKKVGNEWILVSQAELNNEFAIHEDDDDEQEGEDQQEADDEDGDELSTEACVRTVDRENTRPTTAVITGEVGRLALNTATEQFSQRPEEPSSSGNTKAEQNMQAKFAAATQTIQQSPVPQGKSRTANDAIQEAIAKKNRPVMPSSRVVESNGEPIGDQDKHKEHEDHAMRPRNHNAHVPAPPRANIEVMLNIPSVNIIPASPQPIEDLPKTINGMPALGPGFTPTTPISENPADDVTRKWIFDLPKTCYIDPYENANAQLAAAVDAAGPDRQPSIETILRISANVHLHVLNNRPNRDAAYLQQARQPPSATRKPVQGTGNHTFLAPAISAPPQQQVHGPQQTMLPQAPVLHQRQSVPSFVPPQHLPSQRQQASPPPAYRSPPRMAGRLEPPLYWNSSLSIITYCWYRHTQTRIKQIDLISLKLTREPTAALALANPPNLGLRFDAIHFSKVKLTRVLLPDEAVRSMREANGGRITKAEQDWTVLELMSDTTHHISPALARDHAQNPVVSASSATARATVEAQTLAPAEPVTSTEAPYWLLAFPAHAIKSVQMRPMFTGQGTLTHTRLSVGKEGWLPALHGRGVDPWCLEGFLNACGQGEGVIETVSAGALPISG